MTHYSRYCLHLGCGEPLGNALPAAKKQAKAKVSNKQTKHKTGKQESKKKA